MAKLRAQIISSRPGDLPRDFIVNTVHFNIGGVFDFILDGPDPQGIANDVNALFANTRQFVPADYSVQTKVYDCEQAQPREIKATSPLTIYAQRAGVSMPREVALCLSFRGARNLPRQRGRIFIGPWSTSVAGIRPPAGAMANLEALADGLAGIGGVDVDWVVRSTFPKLAGDQGGTMVSIKESWTDDEWDTIRSRGLRPTTRNTHAHNE